MADGLIEFKMKYLKRFRMYNLFHQWAHQEEVVMKFLVEFKQNLWW